MNSRGIRPLLTAVLALCAAALGAAPAVAQEPAPAPDTTGPTVAETQIYGVDGGDPGFIRQGGSAYFYVDVRDASRVTDVRSDVTAWGVDNTSAAYDEANLWMDGGPAWGSTWWGNAWSVRNPLAQGVYPWKIKMTDEHGNQSQHTATVTVDNTRPTARDVQTQNKAGGIVGQPEQGDKIVLTWSEMLNRFLADEVGHDIVVRLDNTSSNDTLRFYSKANNNENPSLGTIKLGADYTTANRTFGATGTKSRIQRVGNTTVITLGTPSGTVKKVTSGAKMTWTPYAGATDPAGNKVNNSVIASESGVVDVEF